jgi:hypothetical protein
MDANIAILISSHAHAPCDAILRTEAETLACMMRESHH